MRCIKNRALAKMVRALFLYTNNKALGFYAEGLLLVYDIE